LIGKENRLVEGLEKEAGSFLESEVGEIENGSAGVSKVLWEHPVRVGDGSRGALLLARSGCGGRARHLVEQGAFNSTPPSISSPIAIYVHTHTYICMYVYIWIDFEEHVVVEEGKGS
jgi:hypothetical protein